MGVVNSVQKFWNGVFQRSNKRYTYADTVFFTGQTDIGCGSRRRRSGRSTAPSTSSCTSTWASSMTSSRRFGVTVTPFVEAYVLAHEYGHHVQDLFGVLDQIRGDTQGPESKSVRAELQADCYAGVWAVHAVETGLDEQLTQADSSI